MADSDVGTLVGLRNLLRGASGASADTGTAKIPLTMLPAGLQPGQRVSLTVTGIDPVTGTATVVPDAVQNAVPAAPETAMAQPIDAIDKELTLGPMDKLKSYLFEKTQDQQQES